jgi:hypothetical protein
MLTARRLTAPVLLTLTVALAYLATAGPAAAQHLPPDVGGTAPPPPVSDSGAPLWTYVVVAVAAALLTLVLAWAVTRLRQAHAGAASPSAA